MIPAVMPIIIPMPKGGGSVGPISPVEACVVFGLAAIVLTGLVLFMWEAVVDSPFDTLPGRIGIWLIYSVMVIISGAVWVGFVLSLIKLLS